MPRLSFVLTSLATAWIATASPAQEAAREVFSEAVPEVAGLLDAMGVPEVLALMVAEGRSQGPSIEADLFQGRGGEGWQEAVDDIYTEAALARLFAEAFVEAQLDPDQLGAASAFYRGSLGTRIVAGEIAARQDMQNEIVAEAAVAVEDRRRAAGEDRIALLDAFAEANALLDLNIAGVITANIAFYRGLAEGGAYDPEPDMDRIRADVLARADTIDASVRDWLQPYHLLAYDGLSDEELRLYISFSRGEAGQTLGRLVFDAFDAMYGAVCFDLGLAAAAVILGGDG